MLSPKQKIFNLLCAALEAKGEKLISRMTGCNVYSRSAGGFYYVGKQGSLRYGTSKANSRTIEERAKQEMLALLELRESE